MKGLNLLGFLAFSDLTFRRGIVILNRASRRCKIMIVSNDNAESRIHNPMNLMNRMQELRSAKQKQNPAMSLFGVRRNINNENEIVFKAEVKEEVVELKQDTSPDNTTIAVVTPVFINPFKKLDTETSDRILETETETETEDKQLTTDDLISDPDNKIKLASAHNDALDLLNSAVKELKIKLSDVSASKLPGVITAASKVVESIRKERLEVHKSGKDKEVHYHFYTPEQKAIEQYSVIDV